MRRLLALLFASTASAVITFDLREGIPGLPVVTRATATVLERIDGNPVPGEFPGLYGNVLLLPQDLHLLDANPVFSVTELHVPKDGQSENTIALPLNYWIKLHVEYTGSGEMFARYINHPQADYFGWLFATGITGGSFDLALAYVPSFEKDQAPRYFEFFPNGWTGDPVTIQNYFKFQTQEIAVPEPGVMGLLAVGLMCLRRLPRGEDGG